MFDYKSGQETLKRRLSTNEPSQYWGTSANFSPDALVLEADARLIATDREAEVKLQLRPSDWLKKSAFSRDGKRVYLGCVGGLLTQHDTATGKELKRFVGHSHYVRAIAISPDEKYIVAGDAHGKAIVWDVGSTQPLVTLTSGDLIITSLDWSSDGRRIVAGKEDGTVQIWTLPRSTWKGSLTRK